MSIHLRLMLVTALCVVVPAQDKAAPAVTFNVTYTAAAFAGPFTGRVVVYLGAAATTEGAKQREPRLSLDWFNPKPMFAVDVAGVKPGEVITVGGAGTIGFPGAASTLTAGSYAVQAVIDRNLGGRAIGTCAGNLYSTVQVAGLDPASRPTVTMVCDRTVVTRPFKETAHVKEVRLESKLLSAFCGRPTFLEAAVVLPDARIADPTLKLPVIYSIPGFGGSHRGRSGSDAATGTLRAGVPFLFVELEPSCPAGHHVFADSANNGPWGTALTTELIPHIERTFGALGTPATRFVTGHSSGGWSSLWLQVTEPGVFGGCWSTSPDPVDFRDFQRIDLTKSGTNLFTDENGAVRPVGHSGGKILVTFRAFSDMERPLRGEPYASFESAFSPRGANGQPLQMWNRDTGAIDAAVAASWKKYDIGLTLRTHWKDLEPRLRGKLHVYTGTEDTFYLEGAVRLLQADLKALGADAAIELFPGDHGTVMTKALRDRIDREMAAQLKQP